MYIVRSPRKRESPSESERVSLTHDYNFDNASVHTSIENNYTYSSNVASRVFIVQLKLDQIAVHVIISVSK